LQGFGNGVPKVLKLQLISSFPLNFLALAQNFDILLNIEGFRGKAIEKNFGISIYHHSNDKCGVWCAESGFACVCDGRANNGAGFGICERARAQVSCKFDKNANGIGGVGILGRR
jgi:hypothetical protein